MHDAGASFEQRHAESAPANKGKYKGRFIIFLDVDDVLNNYSTKDFIVGRDGKKYTGIDDRKVVFLKEIVDMFDAVIVLSSTWKDAWYREPEMKDLQDVFANTLDDRLAVQGMFISDKTFDRGNDRGRGIVAWLKKNGPVSGFLILDNYRFDFPERKIARHWLQTGVAFDGGLKENHVKCIKRRRNNYMISEQEKHLFFPEGEER